MGKGQFLQLDGVSDVAGNKNRERTRRRHVSSVIKNALRNGENIQLSFISFQAPLAFWKKNFQGQILRHLFPHTLSTAIANLKLLISEKENTMKMSCHFGA
jgi:hypothetical protein